MEISLVGISERLPTSIMKTAAGEKDNKTFLYVAAGEDQGMNGFFKKGKRGGRQLVGASRG